MSDETSNKSTGSGETVEIAKPEPKPAQPPALLSLPGLAAIALYLLLLAGICILWVVNGTFRPTYLVFSAFFITASLGLLRLFRWAWAMALAAVVLLAATFMWEFTIGHQYPYLVQGLLNLVFFLYLIRTEVRSKLK
jgi:hypothetical protein